MPSKAQGVDSSTLVIPQIDWSDIGVYVCLAFNELGRTQSKPIYVIMQAQAGTSITGSIIGMHMMIRQPNCSHRSAVAIALLVLHCKVVWNLIFSAEWYVTAHTNTLFSS